MLLAGQRMHKITDGVWQLAGLPRDMFNVYLVEDVLIDAATRWAKRRIIRQVVGKPIRMLALTHCHPDHQGAAKAICDRFGVPLACHEGDVPVMEGRSPLLPDNWLMRLGGRVWAGPACPVGKVLRDGDLVAGFRVVHAPGHTPGHVFFFRDADRVALAGDVLANINFITRRPGLREPPPLFTVDLAQNRRSLQVLIELQPRVVCFGHGPPLWDIAVLERFAARRRRFSG